MATAEGWPQWAMSLFGGLSVGLGLLTLVRKPKKAVSKPEANGHAEKNGTTTTAQSRSEFRSLQRDYLAVYLVIFLADWLQGTNMYTLYSSYGQSVSTLFLTGFTSALFFGTFAGTLVDQYGRKNACVWFCVLEVVINVMEHVNDVRILLLGRVLGGVSTSLLFTAFETWYVSEHRRRGFPEDWLASTFGLAAFGNGCVAVLAGVLAQIACDMSGDIGPFRLAIALTVVALAIILWRWPENTRSSSTTLKTTTTNFTTTTTTTENGGGAAAATVKVVQKKEDYTAEAWATVRRDRNVARLFAVTSLYEGATYTFVFLWVPTLLRHDPSLPTGLVFACLMLCIAAGGETFSLVVHAFSSTFALTAAALAVAAVAALVASLACSSSFAVTIAAFLVLEACVGCLQACASSMRALVVPDHLQASINNLGRAPLNLLVVLGTLLADKATESNKTHLAFLAVASMFGAAAAIQFSGGRHLGGTKQKGL